MPLRGERVLVTGVAGRIGRAIGQRLAGQARIVGIDRLASRWTTHRADLGDPGLPLERWLEGCSAVIHVAALHAPHVGVASDDDFERVNVRATRRLAEAAAAAGVSRFVFTSTTALFGTDPGVGDGARAAAPGARWIDETSAPRPRTVYHRSKLVAEQLLAEVAGQRGLVVTVLRMSRCFPEPADRMAVYRLHRGVDARDVAQAHALSLDGGTPGTVRMFVVSAPTPFDRSDLDGLARDAPRVLARRASSLVQEFNRRGWTLPATIDRVYDARRAIDELGWRPRYGFEAVLQQADAGDPEVLPVAPSTAARTVDPCESP